MRSAGTCTGTVITTPGSWWSFCALGEGQFARGSNDGLYNGLSCVSKVPVGWKWQGLNITRNISTTHTPTYHHHHHPHNWHCAIKYFFLQCWKQANNVLQQARARARTHTSTLSQWGANHTHTHTHTQHHARTDTLTHSLRRRFNMRTFVYLRICGSCSLCSLSAYHHILAVVRTQIHISDRPSLVS